MIYTIAQHELVKLFKTGKIWQLLALCQFILGLIFYWLMEEFLFKSQNLLLENTRSVGITEEVIHPLFAWAALFFFFITPLLATQCVTQERKTHTLDLYLTSPLSSLEIVMGKFIGIFLGEIFLLLPVLIMPLLITLNDHLDIGQFISGLFGLILLLGATLSLGIFVSSLAKEPFISTLVIFISLLLLTALEWTAHFLTPSLQWIAELALLHHCQNFLSGIINTQDIIYYVFFTVLFLSLGAFRLNKESYFKRST